MVALIAANSRLLSGGGRRRPPVLALPRGALRARDQCATLVRARAVCMNSNQTCRPCDCRDPVDVSRPVARPLTQTFLGKHGLRLRHGGTPSPHRGEGGGEGEPSYRHRNPLTPPLSPAGRGSRPHSWLGRALKQSAACLLSHNLHEKQYGTCCNGHCDIFVAQHVIGGTRRRHMPTCTL